VRLLQHLRDRRGLRGGAVLEGDGIMIGLAFAGLVGFVVGVAAMVGYGYSVAFLTLVQEEKRAAENGGEG
jgi:hypothetical protein